MTNKDKSLLRQIMKTERETSDRDAADECNCSVATAQKYRRVFAAQGAGPRL